MSAPPSKQRLQTAVELHQRGELAAAEVIYREILAAEPKQFEAIKMLATIAAQRGNPVAALSLFDEALQLRPSDPTLLNNRGITLVDLGRLNEARDSFKQALELKPDDLGTSRNLGLVLCTLGEQAAAEAHFRRIVELMPKSSQAHFELATALQAAAKYGEARASYRMAIELDPRSIEPHNKLAVMLKDTGNVSEAIDIFKTLISLVPDNDEIYVNFGNALRESGQLIAAEQAYQKAIGLNSDCAEAYNNLGSLLSSLGRLSEAVASFSRAVDLRPDVSSTRSNLLFMLQYLPTPQPGLAETHLAYFRQDRSATVKPYCDWPNALSARAKIADQQSTHESTGSFTVGGSNRLANTLRIGFVSGDLRQHPVGNFLEGVLAELSRRSANRLEVFAYANHFQFDDVSARIKASCFAWHFVHQLPDAVLAEKILLDGIDILIDLSGHSGRNRLPMFNYRPAPVQATWLGYLGTTSVMAMDYLIADAWTLPSELEPDFTEEIWRIPGSYVCFTKPVDAPQVGPLPALLLVASIT
jgi:protein O-GlcNAc transferase